MIGYQLSFFTVQSQQHGGTTMTDWLMQVARDMGLRGITLVPGIEGFGRHGRVHSAHFFELADQPVEIMMAATEDESAKLFQRIKDEGAKLFYVKTRVEFGTVGETE